jgi:hypothetical protein
MINYDVPMNTRGNNANIKANLGVSDDTMRDYGFYQRNGQLIYMEDLGYDVSLNICVLCDSVFIDVIDEEFLQLYDYQRMLRNPENVVALEIHSRVQAIMKRLSDAGIIEGWVANEYI